MGRRLGIAWMLLAAASPAGAQTELACQTAAAIVAASPYAGSALTLSSQYDRQEDVDRLVKVRFGEQLAARPDLVQVYYLGSGRHLVMASVQGCHVAHEFADDAG